jgi:putative glutamine amidotransferase
MLICGGGDVHPRRYGREPEADVELVFNEDRDGMELSLLAEALEADVPTLCIGRGMQVLNVALGGALIQDIPGHSANLEGDECVSAYHRIYISPGSKLAAIVGSGGFVRVNSRHHQGLREAQKSALLLASAYSLDDGVIEALESPDHRWVVGVQFHPERRGEMPPHFDRLFQSLVDRALERTIAAISR